MSIGGPGTQAADDEAVALGDRQLDEALLLAAHAVERLGGGQPDERAVEVVGPGVERTGEAAGLADAVHHPDAAVAAGVDHRVHPTVAVPGQQDRRAHQVDRAVAARRRAARRRGRGRAAGDGTGRRARPRGGQPTCRGPSPAPSPRRRGRWCPSSMWSSKRRARLRSSASLSTAPPRSGPRVAGECTLTHHRRPALPPARPASWRGAVMVAAATASVTRATVRNVVDHGTQPVVPYVVEPSEKVRSTPPARYVNRAPTRPTMASAPAATDCKRVARRAIDLIRRATGPRGSAAATSPARTRGS